MTEAVTLEQLVEELLRRSSVEHEVEAVWVNHDTVLNPPQVEVWVIVNRVDSNVDVAIYEALGSLYTVFPLPTEVDIRVFSRPQHPHLELPATFGQAVPLPSRSA